MAGKLISDLNSGTLSLADAMEIDKDVSGTRTSFKTTVKDIVDFANHNVADEYDSTSTYAIGDYVMYESTLYKCITAVSSAENFDLTKWTAVLVTDEMGSGGGGGTGGHTIIDENGNSMTARAGLQFFGAVEVTDDSANNRTLVEVLGGDFYNPVIYSTEEREVGVWTDGKPLYEKTIDLGNTVSISYNSWTLLDYDISNIETLVYCNTPNYGNLMAGKNPNGQLQCQTARNNDTVTSRYLTLHYTKTTDTAGSGSWTPQGVPAVHYSTDEQVIGTWLGETLYQKTLHISNVQFDSTGIYDLNLTSMGTDILIADNSCSYYTFSTHVRNFEKLVPEDGHIYCYGVANRPITDGYITIKYTKTS